MVPSAVMGQEFKLSVTLIIIRTRMKRVEWLSGRRCDDDGGAVDVSTVHGRPVYSTNMVGLSYSLFPDAGRRWPDRNSAWAWAVQL